MTELVRATQGLKRKTADGVFDVRRTVPADVRHVFEGKIEFVESLRTADLRLAMRRRDEVWSRWSAQIEEARRTGAAAPEHRSLVLQSIEAWRLQRCEAALGVDPDGGLRWKAPEVATNPGRAAIDAIVAELGVPLFTVDLSHLDRPAKRISVGASAAELAKRYFKQHPDASREAQIPYAVGMLLGRLQAAERDPEAWRNIDGFDDQVRTALDEVGVGLKLTPRLLGEVRHPFAKAWLEVVRHEEAARQRAAAFLAAIDSARMDSAAIRAAASSRSYVPREDDHSLSELVTAYRADRGNAFSEESTGRKYNHIFTALEEALGAGKPIRAIMPEDCQKVRDILRALPTHMGKRYPGMTMAEAIEASDEDEAQRLAPNTVNSYMSNLIAMFNWAIKVRRWMEFNPAAGLVNDNLPSLERRSFEPEELTKVFSGLAAEKDETPWKYWVPAIGLCAGARLNEICQLTKDDVSEFGGIHYLRMTIFDPSGRRNLDKKLKRGASKRNVPLHPQLIAAGFLEYIAKLEPGRLFPELPLGPNGGYSHYASTWFGTYLDRIDLSDPCLVFHSFRHGFKEACQAAEIQDSVWRALGGWAAGDVAERYGRRDMVPTLHEAIKKVRFGGFYLPPLVTPSATGEANRVALGATT